MHVKNVPKVRLLSPVLTLACNQRAASVDGGKEKTRLIDASEEHYANCWLISLGQLSMIWTPVLGGHPEDKTGRDFTGVWCNHSALFTKLEVFLLWRIKNSSLKSTALCLWFLQIPNIRTDKKKQHVGHDIKIQLGFIKPQEVVVLNWIRRLLIHWPVVS